MYGALAVDSPVRVSEGAMSAYGDRSESLGGRTCVERIEEEEDLLDRPGRVETAASDEHRRLIHTFIPVVCSIFGVILFMRLGTVVGAIGLRQTWIVVGIAFGITFLTVGSLSALASGNERARKARGILRSLEQVVGTHVSQGLAGLFYLSFTIAAAYHLLGFSEIMLFYLGIDRREHKLPWSDEGSWSTLLLSSGLLLVVVILRGMGARVSRRALRVVFGVFAVAVVCSIMFLLIPDAKMHTGASVSRLQTNWDPESSEGVITMFGFFFPGFTGVIAGANLADNLVLSSFKYGSRSSRRGVGQVHLVVGTHTALVFSLVVYLGLSLVLAASADRKLLEEEHFVVQLVVDSFLGIPVIFLGVGFTTLSAAFANVAGAASAIQFLRPIQNYHGRTEDTNIFTRGAAGDGNNQSSSDSVDIFWAWQLSQVCLLCGSVDSVIPVISATFLLVFAVVNFVCFYQEISNPVYKPSFSMYSKWTALLGLCLSLGGLFLVLSATFLVVAATCAVIVAMYCPGMFINIVGSVRRYSSGRSRTLSSTVEESSISTQSFEFNQQVLFDQMATAVAEQDDEYDNAVQLAALYVRDAIHGRFLGDAYATVSHHKLEIKRWFHALQYVRVANVLVLVLLSFFEVPSWCYYGDSCGDPNVVLAWNLPRLPRTVTMLIELGNLVILMLEMTLKYKYLGKRLYFANKWHILQVTLVVANSVSVLLVMFVPDRMSMAGESGDLPPLVLSPTIRPMLVLTMSGRLRSAFVSLVRITGRVMDGLLTVATLVVIYAICGMVLFEGTSEGNQYFNSFDQATLSLMILLTTANFPDVMMPAYNQCRFTSLFFTSFLAIGLLLVMNLVFASIYQNYRLEITQRANLYAPHRQDALEFAFKLLPGRYRGSSLSEESDPAPTEKVITANTFEALLSELLRPVVSVFHSRRETSVSRFHEPFEQENQEMDFATFTANVKAYAARQSSKRGRKKSYNHRRNGSTFVSTFIQVVRSKWFEHFIDMLILVNLCVILVEVQAKIDGEEDAYSQLERFMPLFSCFYVIEMVIKLYASGAAVYFDSGKNIYDCVVTLVILTAEVSIQVHYSQGENWEWIRILLLLRFLRCLRLLVALQSISTMFGVVVRLLPAFTTLYGMLAIVMCEYAAVGVQLFGGKLVRGDPRLAEVAYGKDDYYPNNFNDYASAITTLFELLIVNNWNVIMEGVETVTSKWCRVYFLSFYVIAVVMVLNLVIAFIVEAYFEQAGASEPRDQLSKEKSSSEVDTPEQSLAEGSQASHHILRKRAFVVRPRADSVYIEEFL